MSRNSELHDLLDAQRIPQDSDAMRELQDHRAEVESLIHNAFPGASITIRYGGSKAKGTMIKESYDLDIIVYVHHGETSIGDSLAEIYANIADALNGAYFVEPKNSALRLYAKTDSGPSDRLHIDVVPGRFVDDTRGDAFIFQNEGQKSRLKTNLQTHVDHIKDSGVTDVLKLMKLVRVRQDADVKQFALDLLTVKVLDGKRGDSVDGQLTHVLSSIRDTNTPVSIEDPANPAGNDLTHLLSGHVWSDLQSIARGMLDQADTSGWAAAFGDGDTFDAPRVAVITQTAETVDEPTKPWAR